MSDYGILDPTPGYLVFAGLAAVIGWFWYQNRENNHVIDRNGIPWILGSSQNVTTGEVRLAARPELGYEKASASRMVYGQDRAELLAAIDLFAMTFAAVR